MDKKIDAYLKLVGLRFVLGSLDHYIFNPNQRLAQNLSSFYKFILDLLYLFMLFY